MMNQIAFDDRHLTINLDHCPLVIRAATSKDRQTIIKNINTVCAEEIYLHSDAFVSTPVWEAVLNGTSGNGSPRLLIVAEVEGRIIGHGRLFPNGFGHKDRHVADVGIALLKPYRELGIGAKLLECMIIWANIARYEKLTATVIATNQRALNLFARSGFVKEGVRVRQFKIRDQYIDEILLCEFLNYASFQ